MSAPDPLALVSPGASLELPLVRFFAEGTPAPKGSPQVVTRGRGGRPLPFPKVLADSPATVAWAKAVAVFARMTMRDLGREPFAGKALHVTLLFGLERPLGHYSKADARRVLPSAPPHPAVKPDIDKLARTTFDAMQGVIFDEDSRIVRLEASKVYAERGGRTGALITVSGRCKLQTDEQHYLEAARIGPYGAHAT